MRILRSLALAVVVGAAYFAQAILDRGTLAGFFPNSILGNFPFLLRMTRWLPQDLLVFAAWLAVVAALGFGLLSPLWRGEARANQGRRGAVLPSARPSWVGIALLVGAGLLIAAAAAGIRAVPMHPTVSNLLWVAGIGLYLAGGYLASPRSGAARTRSAGEARSSPLDGWPIALALLALTAALSTVRWADLPASIDMVTAKAGLQAATLFQGGSSWFEASGLPVPRLASAGTAVGQLLTGDALTGVRLAGLYSGLLLVAAVWLLGCELFWRRPAAGRYGEAIEDDGRFPALIAAAVAASGAPFLVFARLPLFLEGVAWASLGLWAMLYALRRGSLLLLGASGLLLGLATVYGPNGISLIGVDILIWAGILVLWPDWMAASRWGSGRRLAYGVAYWTGGVIAVALPVFVGVSGASGGMSAYLSMNLFAESLDPAWQAAAQTGMALPAGSFVSSLQAALLSPSAGADRSAILGFQGHMLSSVIAPVFVLALGALLMSVDTLLGWTLLSWFVAGAAFSVLWAHPLAPHWPSLLVIWPAVALATAFGLDRLRVTAMLSIGTWMMQASVYLIVGLAAGAAMLNWISYFEQGQAHTDSASAIGREVRRAALDGQRVVLVSSTPVLAGTNPVVEFLSSQSSATVQIEEFTPGSLPDSLAGDTRLLLPVGDPIALERTRSLYPAGRLMTQRDIAGNPEVYVFEISP